MTDNLLSVPDLRKKTRLSRSRIYALVAAGQFPKQIRIGRSSLWLESEVGAWIKARKAERDAALQEA